MTQNDESEGDIQMVVNDFKNKYDTENKIGFVAGVKESFWERAQKTAEAVEAPTFLEKGLGVAGQAAGLATDILGQGISAVIPEFIKKPLGKVVQKVAESDPVKFTVQKYQEWAKSNPRAAKNLEATVNIITILPIGPTVAKIGTKGVGKTIIGKTAGVLERSALEATEASKGAFVRDLIRPIQTKAIKEAQVARTSETGYGLFKKSIVAPTTTELKAEKAILSIPEIKPSNTFQQNWNIINNANKKEAQLLERALTKNDFAYPKKELIARLNTAKKTLSENPALVGDAAKSADKLIVKITQMVDEAPAKGSNLLRVRKEFDKWVESQKGAGVFDPVRENAFSIANRDIRQTLNTFLDEKAPSVGVKASLQKQSSLYRALENITPKAAREADSAVGRAFENMKRIVGLKNATVQEIAAIVGIGGLGAASFFAPPAAIVMGTGFILWRAGKIVLNPKLRSAMAILLKEVDKKLPTIIGQAQRQQLMLEIGMIKALLEQPTEK